MTTGWVVKWEKTKAAHPVSLLVMTDTIRNYIDVIDEYGNRWRAYKDEDKDLYDLAYPQREGGVEARLPYNMVVKHLHWGWTENRLRLQRTYGAMIQKTPCRCDPPFSGLDCNRHCIKVEALTKAALPELEEYMLAATGWLSYYQERLGWCESELLVLQEAMRLHRAKKMDELKPTAGRILKESLEALAFERSKILKDGMRQEAYLKSEVALLLRVEQYWQTVFKGVSRVISLRLGEKERV